MKNGYNCRAKSEKPIKGVCQQGGMAGREGDEAWSMRTEVPRPGHGICGTGGSTGEGAGVPVQCLPCHW